MHPKIRVLAPLALLACGTAVAAGWNASRWQSLYTTIPEPPATLADAGRMIGPTRDEGGNIILGITDKALQQSHADLRAGIAASERGTAAAVRSGSQAQSLAKGTTAVGIDFARMQSDPAYAEQMQQKMASMSDAEKMQMAMQFNSAFQKSQTQAMMQNQAGFTAGVELSNYAAQSGETMASLDRAMSQRLADMTQRYDARHEALDDSLHAALRACPQNYQCGEAGCGYDPQCLRSLDTRVPGLIAQHRKFAEAELGEIRKLYSDAKGSLQPVFARTAELTHAAETAGSDADHLGVGYGQLGGAALRLQTIDGRAALRVGYWAGIKPRTIEDSLSDSGPLGYGYVLAAGHHVDAPPDLPRGW